MAARGDPAFSRVTVTVLGIFSPRGVFNIAVRLYTLNGLARYKFDIPDSLMTLDFEPGVKVNPAEVRSVMVKAGYRPGPFKIEALPVKDATDEGRGWFKPPKVDSRSAFIRWLRINF